MKTGLFSADTGPGYLFPAVAAVFLARRNSPSARMCGAPMIAYFALRVRGPGTGALRNLGVRLEPAFVSGRLADHRRGARESPGGSQGSCYPQDRAPRAR